MRFLTIGWVIVLMLMSGCVSAETNATATANMRATELMLWVEEEGRITEPAPTLTPVLLPEPTSLPTTTPSPAPTAEIARLPLHGNLPFDFAIEIYTYTITTGDVQRIQVVTIEHNQLQPATRYSIDGFNDEYAEITLVDGVADTVGAYGVCETLPQREYDVSPLLSQHWLRTLGALEFFEPGTPFEATHNGLPSEHYTFFMRAAMDADDTIDFMSGSVYTHHFNNENYVTMQANIDAETSANPITGQTGPSTINYQYSLTLPSDGFGIERPVNCTQPNIVATPSP